MNTNEGLEGSKYNKLTLLRYAGTFEGKPHWEAECDCGVVQLYQLNNILGGNTKSCGCLRREQSPKNLLKGKRRKRIKLKLTSKVTMSDWNEEL